MKSRKRHLGQLLLVGCLIVLVCSSCGNSNGENDALGTNQSNEAVQQVENVDNSVRAIGEAIGGQLIVKPASSATAVPLGAPSCYGLETDLEWQGDYRAYWVTGKEGAEQQSAEVFTFPADFQIIQQSDAPIAMQSFKLENTELFAYVPRYTDCHAQETYFFGVEDGAAFPVPLHVQDDLTWPNIGQLPHHHFKVDDERGELILTGGYGAGQEYINVYHFVYDAKGRFLELKQTEQIKPADLPADSN
ncbi:hypothetical protein [Paenibacillus albus]|uniref:Lipoprotein n=1 Tax=Paenibacillus albus TaxID=2495582 RepID=A0A3S9A3H3_9BACL|nr:hypothetical protein [Paenibacillus albus]AZN40288.1 hypothetical protein EJC50_12015 [Paenibacillus albus]